MYTVIRLTGVALLAALAAGPCCAQTSAASDIRLQPGDALRLESFPELSALPGEVGRPAGQYTVDDEGRVLLPVAGLIQVAGRPFSEVRREVERAFAREFVDAAVRITPLLRIAVLGEVRQPGLLPVDPTMSLADVVAAAGGLTDSADRGKIRLLRDGETLVLDAGGDLAGLGIPVASGDRVVVGRRSWTSENLPFLISAGVSVITALTTALILR